MADAHRRNDPTPDRGAQLPRAAALITASLGFVHDLRAGLLEPDSVRGVPLDMDQYTRLFGVARVPSEVSPPPVPRDFADASKNSKRGCKMVTALGSRHVVVLRRGQFCELPHSHTGATQKLTRLETGLTYWMVRTVPS